MKQTEIGLIPDDWEVKTLNDYFDIGSSKRVFQSQWRKRGIPFYRAREIVILAEKNSVENDLFIDEDLYNQYKNLYGIPAVNDLLVTGVGTLGKVYKIQNNKPFYFKDGNIICLKNKGNIDSDYVKYHFDYPIVKDQINDNSGKSTVGTYTINSARKTTLPIPPLPEQQRIAKALSDVDALIFTTEKLLQKKRNIKQGTMQNLLTGKKRLPGFAKSTNTKMTELGEIPEDWEVKKLGEFTRIQAGGTPSTLFEEYWNGNIRWMNSGELNMKRVYEVEGRITELGLANSSTHLFPKNCVLIGLAGQGKTRGTAAINYVELCTNQSIAAIFPSFSHNSEFLYQNIDNRYNELRELSDGGGGRGGLNLKIIGNLEIALPPKEEQNSIAKILSDMDNEIDLLNTKLEKYRNLKTAMMQQLLTGKIRLV